MVVVPAVAVAVTAEGSGKGGGGGRGGGGGGRWTTRVAGVARVATAAAAAVARGCSQSGMNREAKRVISCEVCIARICLGAFFSPARFPRYSISRDAPKHGFTRGIATTAVSSKVYTSDKYPSRILSCLQLPPPPPPPPRSPLPLPSHCSVVIL